MLLKKNVSNYKFIKPYEVRRVVGGVVGIENRNLEVGTVVEGISENDNSVTVYVDKNWTSKIPIEYIEKTNEPIKYVTIKKTDKPTQSTQPTQPKPPSQPKKYGIFSTKNIIIATIATIAIVGILKWKKII
jgi:hypothetical protein